MMIFAHRYITKRLMSVSSGTDNTPKNEYMHLPSDTLSNCGNPDITSENFL
jgi:hypothetical protein